jgi:hypothetical protein
VSVRQISQKKILMAVRRYVSLAKLTSIGQRYLAKVVVL